jgi:opacity protein-like surface antigen
MKMRKYFVVAGLVLLACGTAFAQDFPRVETAPAFMYIHTSGNLGLADQNCVGGGGTIAYNVTSLIGIAADLGGCEVIDLPNPLSANLFTYLFGPRFTFRNSSKFTPFFEVNFGGARLSGTFCNSGCASGSTNAFAMTAGGGFDIKVSRKIAIRAVQVEYLYTRFGNNLSFTNNVNQNSVRLKSGIVIGWGGGQ